MNSTDVDIMEFVKETRKNARNEFERKYELDIFPILARVQFPTNNDILAAIEEELKVRPESIVFYIPLISFEYPKNMECAIEQYVFQQCISRRLMNQFLITHPWRTQLSVYIVARSSMLLLRISIAEKDLFSNHF